MSFDFDETAEDDLYPALDPTENLAMRLLSEAAKTQSEDQERMEDFWGAVLAAYFPLKNKYMISRKTTGGAKLMMVSRTFGSKSKRLLLVLAFSDNYMDSPFKAVGGSAKNIGLGDWEGMVVFINVSAVTFRLSITEMDRGGALEHKALIVKNSAGPEINFGDNSYHMDNDNDRRKLDNVFRLMLRPGSLNRALHPLQGLPYNFY